MKMNDIFPSKYLKSDDLKNKSYTLAIERCAIEKLGEDQKLVIYFQGAEKGLACNKTNADRIAYLYGDDTDMWSGKKVTLYSELVSFQGKTGPAIRVRPPEKRGDAPATPAPAAKPVPATNGELYDEIPF